MKAVELTAELVRIKTVNPPGDEHACATYLGRLLESAGFSVKYDEFAEQRTSLVATIGGNVDVAPLCITGHIDTVPLGNAAWSNDAFAADMDNGRMYGRGASDMKSGVAAFVIAAINLVKHLDRSPGLVLVITAGEELGCLGSKHLALQPRMLGRAGAIVVGEPTANYPVIGHKGSIKFHAHLAGVTAHGAMPERGVNAIYKAASAVALLQAFDFDAPNHAVMGKPTLNVGTISGGLNVNSVPDAATIGVDIRTVPGIDHDELLARLKRCLGDEVEIATYQNEIPVWTEPENAWVQNVYDVVTPFLGERPRPQTESYFTDAGSLRRAYDFPPTVILGPGEPTLAHQTDEYCYVARIDEAVEIYTQIVRRWCHV